MTERPGSGDQTREHEQQFFDEQYARTTPDPIDTAETFEPSITPAHLPGGTSGGLVHLEVYRAIMRLGLDGKSVLDYGCGAGHWGIRLAQLGGQVSGFDLSAVGIERAKRRAEAARVDARFQHADARRLPYPDDTFDIVVGINVLHHTIKYQGTNDELLRVMKSGGHAFFSENLGHNPVFQVARRFSMVDEEAGDVILTIPVLTDWARGFTHVDVQGYNLFMMAKRMRRFGRVLPLMNKLDEALLPRARWLRKYCGESVITLRK